MFRTIIIGPDAELAERLQWVLADLRAASVVRVLEQYPHQVHLARILRAHAPQLVFLAIDSIELCAATTAQIEQIMPGVQVIAVGRSCEAETLMTVMRTGIREFLAFPFEGRCVLECLQRADENLKRRPVAVQSTELMYSFLPSKPGSGTTTLALNAAIAAAGSEGGVLLADFDLNCGMMRFLLKLVSQYSIVDALGFATNMDEQLWPQLVSRAAGIDVLQAGSSKPEIRIEALQVQQLMEYARRNYRVVCADLSGNLEKYSLEVMHESKRVFLVCTPEDPSLHLAREKVLFLQNHDLGDRVSILLNRCNKRSEIKPEHIEDLVGAPVLMSFPNDYTRVTQAIRQGTAIDPKSDLGRQCCELGTVLNTQKPVATEKKRRFVEYFNITPARFSFEGRR